jgi:lipopolysaccharide transport system permease protein
MNEMEIVLHTPARPFEHPFAMLRELFRDLLASRSVAWEMMTRDLRSQYRTSIAGVLIPLLPALTTACWAILFRDAHLINVGTIDMPYPFFVLCGMMLWAAFLESMDAPISGVMAEQGLLSKANIPVEAVTMSRLGQVLFNFGIKTILIVLAAVFYQVHVPLTIVLAPLGLLMIVLLGASIGMILAPLNLLYTDINKALPVITTFWFFTTPIIFTAPDAGWAAFLMKYVNPMTPLLNTTRELAFGNGHGISQPVGFLVTSCVTLALLLIGTIFHRIAMPIVIDRANA